MKSGQNNKINLTYLLATFIFYGVKKLKFCPANTFLF